MRGECCPLEGCKSGGVVCEARLLRRVAIRGTAIGVGTGVRRVRGRDCHLIAVSF